MKRGVLRVYLGAAPGVGKTFAMLNEGWRRHERGTDVVVGLMETHGRAVTAAQVRDLEVIPRRIVEHRGASFEELDVDAVIARHPALVLIDELPHTNQPGSRHAKRWQDVEEVLEAGIDVVTCVNIQHLESLNDVVEQITGIRQPETVPDSFVRSADQIEIVDMAPEALRRRMAHGNIYRAEKVDAALAHYFRVQNLAALRELALLWVADRVEDGLADYRKQHGTSETWETRERVVVTVTGAPGSDRLVRRAARIAGRNRAELIGVHVRPTDGLSRDGDQAERLQAARELLSALGGRYVEIYASSVAEALVEVARAENATQLVVGATAQSRWSELVSGSVLNDLLRRAGSIDVHVIRRDEPDPVGRPLPSLPSSSRLTPLSSRRRWSGWAMAIVVMPATGLAMTTVRSHVGPAGSLLIMLGLVVATAAAGGLVAALVGALVGFLTVDWYFVPPIHHWRISQVSDVVDLLMFVLIAAAVSVLVDRLARRGAEVRRVTAEAETMVGMAATASVGGTDAIGSITEELRVALGLETVAVAVRGPEGLRVEATAGQVDGARDSLITEVALGTDTVLLLTGHVPDIDDQRVLHAFAAQLDAVHQSAELQSAVERANERAAGDDLRTAILAAVSHDLRTPIASIKASATSVLADDVEWDSEAIRAFFESIDHDADRLNLLITDLLDMSRLQAGVVSLNLKPVSVRVAVGRAVAALTRPGCQPRVEIEDEITALADPALLERVLVNVLDNAALHGAAGGPVHVQANRAGGEVTIRVIDQGPGIPPDRRDDVLRPFQRLGDMDASTTGLGLGLALSRGFMHAMDGELAVDDTPGGGATVVLELKSAR